MTELRGLSGKVVFITGAGRGQGANHARNFAEAGCRVVVTDICEPIDGLYSTATKEQLDLTVSQIKERGAEGLGIQMDVRDEAQIRSAVDQAIAAFGQIDILVNNAGMASAYMMHEMPEYHWDTVLDICLKGQALTSKHVIPGMISRRSGKIINISSATIGSGMTMMSHYVSAKHGVVGLTQSLATELSEFGINVNAVAPGSIRPTDEHGSGMVRGAASEFGFPADGLDFFETISERLNFAGDMWRCEMQDITDAVLFLASDNARIISGICLPVDAGEMTR
jgi:(+)-trans-carveol dehydrogenase